jgi:hypothetical protein
VVVAPAAVHQYLVIYYGMAVMDAPWVVVV